MAELDEQGNEPNFDFFESFRLDFFSDDELLLTETDLTEQTETTEQEEIGQINDKDIDNFVTENRDKNTNEKTHGDLKVFYRWAKTVNKTRTLENIWTSRSMVWHKIPGTICSLLASFSRTESGCFWILSPKK